MNTNTAAAAVLAVVSAGDNRILCGNQRRRRQKLDRIIMTPSCVWPSPNETLPLLSGTDPRKSNIRTSRRRWTPLSLAAKLFLPLQLAVAIDLLLVVPYDLALYDYQGYAEGSHYYWWWLFSLEDRHNLGALPYEYMTLFSLLLLPRAYQYGSFAPRVENRQIKSQEADGVASSSFGWSLLFLATLIGSHWLAAFQYTSSILAGSSSTRVSDTTTTVNILLLGIRWLSIVLVAWSGQELGKSYDRVTRPDALIQTGPYAIVRHPIYTAYLMLFGSTLLTLQAYALCAVFLVVAILFYRDRMQTEDDLLLETFGADFERYREKVPWLLIPYVF